MAVNHPRQQLIPTCLWASTWRFSAPACSDRRARSHRLDYTGAAGILNYRRGPSPKARRGLPPASAVTGGIIISYCITSAPEHVACFDLRRRGRRQGFHLISLRSCGSAAPIASRCTGRALPRCVRAATEFLFLRRNSIFHSRSLSGNANLCKQELSDASRGWCSTVASSSRDMGKLIEFKRRKPAGFIPEQGRPPINLAEPLTAAKFPARGQGNDTAPSEYCAPDSDGA
jgi:hypothetical protein